MIVITSQFGQLGNRLLIFAKFITLARHENLQLMNLGFSTYAEHFEVLQHDPLCRYPSGKRGGRVQARLARLWYKRAAGNLPGTRVVHAGQSKEFDLADPAFVEQARRGTVIFASGWPRLDVDYKADYADEVRAYFRPRADIKARVADVMRRARVDCDVLVGLHVRQGDYRTWEGGRHYFSSAQYAALAARLAALYPGQRVKFLVVSDERQDPAVYADLPVTFGAGGMVEDLYSLAACDAIAGPTSTFAGWASFYGRVPRWKIDDIEGPLTLADLKTVAA